MALQINSSYIHIFKILAFFTFLLVTVNSFADNHSLLIEPETLKNSNPEDVIIIDARSHDAYLKNHIENARHLDVNKTFHTKYPDRVGTVRQIEPLLQKIGIHQDSHLVVYDDGEFINAGRLFWVLELFGIKKVSLLNGGFPLWKQKNFPTTTKFEIPVPSNFRAVLNTKLLGTKQDAHISTIAQNITMLDARSKEKYDNSHIPFSYNVAWNQNIDKSAGIAKIKPKEDLLDIYADLPEDKLIMTYCHKGKQSSFAYFVLRHLGYKVNHYDGSWHEWSQDPNMPKASNKQ